MSEVVNEVIKREKKYKIQNRAPIYRRSYEESLKRPISGSDFGYEIPLRGTHYLEAILSKEELAGEQTADMDTNAADAEKYVVYHSLFDTKKKKFISFILFGFCVA